MLFATLITTSLPRYSISCTRIGKEIICLWQRRRDIPRIQYQLYRAFRKRYQLGLFALALKELQLRLRHGSHLVDDEWSWKPTKVASKRVQTNCLSRNGNNYLTTYNFSPAGSPKNMNTSRLYLWRSRRDTTVRPTSFTDSWRYHNSNSSRAKKPPGSRLTDNTKSNRTSSVVYLRGKARNISSHNLTCINPWRQNNMSRLFRFYWSLGRPHEGLTYHTQKPSLYPSPVEESWNLKNSINCFGNPTFGVFLKMRRVGGRIEVVEDRIVRETPRPELSWT